MPLNLCGGIISFFSVFFVFLAAYFCFLLFSFGPVIFYFQGLHLFYVCLLFGVSFVHLVVPFVGCVNSHKSISS